ncbi:MAG: SdrD B-like domain-containing protein [Thiolinea sp.]
MQSTLAADVDKLEIQNSNVSAQIESVDSKQAEQEKLKTIIENAPPAYQDKVMSTPELLELTTQEAEEVESEGFQSYFLETRANYADSKTGSSDQRKTGDLGTRFEYLYETANFGDLKIQAQTSQQADNKNQDSLRFEQDDQDTSVTLINNNLYLTPAIVADSALGDIASELTDALRRGSRVSLGLDTVRGARTQIRGKNFDLRLGTGDLGELSGSPYSGYRQTDGRLSWIGGSHRLGDDFVFGVQVDQLNRFKNTANANSKISSAALALNYDSDDKHNKKLRITVLNSQHTNETKQTTQAQGAYLEGGFQLGRYSHEFGAYKADPELYFGANRLSSDQQGVYWNFNREGSRFIYSAGVSVEQDGLQAANRETKSERLGMTGNLRYKIDRDRSYGGSLRLQQTRYDKAEQNDQRSVYAYGYYELMSADWGLSRFSVTLHHNEKIVSNDVAATGDELQWTQDWLGNSNTILSAQPELTTTLGLAHDRSASDTQTYPTAGVNARYWLNPDWSMAGNLRYTSRSGRLSTSQGLAGSVTSEYKLTQDLLVGGSLSLNQAKVEVDRNGINEASSSRSNDKSVQAYLRWEGSRGREHSVIGQRTVGLAGAGSTSGYVFFDNNQDGQRQADEIGVPEVEVYLDGGYSVRTDKNGYYEFMRVATGKHTLTLNLDTVPLPWSVKEESLSVDISLRGQVTANLALTKGAD